MFKFWTAEIWEPGVGPGTEYLYPSKASFAGVLADPEPTAKMVAELLNASGEYEEDFAASDFQLEKMGPWGYRVLARDPDTEEMDVEFGVLLRADLDGFLEE